MPACATCRWKRLEAATLEQNNLASNPNTAQEPQGAHLQVSMVARGLFLATSDSESLDVPVTRKNGQAKLREHASECARLAFASRPTMIGRGGPGPAGRPHELVNFRTIGAP